METKYKKILIGVMAFTVVLALVVSVGFLDVKKAKAAETCQQGQILCGDACYSVPYCYACTSVAECGDSGLGCSTYRCNGGSGGGPPTDGNHYCYCGNSNGN